MTQFDATARINVDLSGFARAASQASSSTGAWTAATNSLQTSLNRVQTISKQEAAELSRTLAVYQKMTSAVSGYATAVGKLDKLNNESAASEKKFEEALGSLSNQLSKVQGLSSKEASRLNRTVELYAKLAKAVDTYASALQKMEALGNREAAEQQKQEAAATRNATAQVRLQQAETQLAAAQQRLAAQEARTAAAQQKMAESGESASGAFDHISASTFALRSTLGELEQSYQSVLRVLVQIPEATAGSAIAQESAYAQVARVVGDADANANHLYQGLQKISTDLPIDFKTTAAIAQLGAQIGITADQLISFTRTVAAFSVTTGIGADQVTLLFGQIKEMENIPITEIDNFASAVLKLGTVSAATEEEILNVNDSIATVTNVFGLSTQAALGLSSAFATLRIRPELARGSLTRVFGQLEDAVDGSGDALKALSAIMGLTADQVKNLRDTDPDDFFLRFIEGLKNASDQGVSFRSSLRDLSITAVRDIDTISRLANNYDVLSDSIQLSYAEYAKNTELTKQSQRIYDTTANRIGNLEDAFENFAANAGKPLAALVAVLAKAGSTLLDFINAVPNVGIVVGGIATAVVIGSAAWVAYRLALIKTLTTVVAVKEAQQQLNGQSISLSTVLKLMNSTQTQAAISAREANAAFTAEAVSVESLVTALTPAAAAVLEISEANQALTITQTQAASSARAVGAAFAFNNTAVNANTAALEGAFNALNQNNSAMSEAIVLGATFRNTTIGITEAQVAETAAVEASTGATVEATAATRAFSLSTAGMLGGLALVGTALAYVVPALLHTQTSAQKLTASVIQAAGGLGELAKAIQDDTTAAQSGGPVYDTIRVGIEDMTDATVEAAKQAIANAKAQKQAITLVHGSTAELQAQARGSGTAATAAKAYLAQIANANKTIQSNTDLLKENTVVLGDNAKKWLENAFDAAASESGITKNKDALQKLLDTGVNVQGVLTKALTDPATASKTLGKAIDDLNTKINEIKTYAQGGSGKYGQSMLDSLGLNASDLGSYEKARDFLTALQGSTKALGDEAAATAVKNQLLGDQLEATPQQAALAKAGFGDVATALEALGDGADASDDDMEALAQTISGFGTPVDAFSAAFDKVSKSTKQGTDDAADALNAFSNSAKVSLDEYEKQLDKILDAQANWSANLIVIAQRLGPDIASEFAKLGPEAAPMIQKLVDASDKELAKLKPKLEATTSTSVSAISGVILAGIPEIQGASKQTASVIATAFKTQLEAGKVPFEQTVNEFSKILSTLDKQKGKPRVELQDGDAKKSLADLQKLIADASSDGSLDPEGTASLNAGPFNDKANALKSQTQSDSKSGKYDPQGTAQLNPGPYDNQRDKIIKELQMRENAGYFNPKGTAQLNTGTYYAQLANLRSSSLTTGRTIQANLTKSATVSVGYYYYQKNSPPKTLKAADGGWITGPGGPRDDKIPTMLSNKEFVVNAAAAAQYGPVLEAINRIGGQGGGPSTEVVAGAFAKSGAGVPSTGSTAPEKAMALTSGQPGRPQTVIHVTNYYPQAEPTSATVNRSLAFAATLDGTL